MTTAQPTRADTTKAKAYNPAREADLLAAWLVCELAAASKPMNIKAHIAVPLMIPVIPNGVKPPIASGRSSAGKACQLFMFADVHTCICAENQNCKFKKAKITSM